MKTVMGVLGLPGMTLALFVLVSAATARAGPITLPVGQVAQLDYSGYETFHDLNGNRLADASDYFDGIVRFQSITAPLAGVDLSAQLADKELTAHFRFSVIGGSSGAGHIEFGLMPDDFFRLYVGEGAAKNYDPTAPDAVARATDGELWLAVGPGPFFESVNDAQPGGATLNRAWMDLATNNTGYGLAAATFPSLLGRDPSHTYLGAAHGDHPVQLYFENNVAGLSDVPGFTFRIFGPVFLRPVPEPSSLALVVVGLVVVGVVGLALARRRRTRAATMA